MLAEAVLRRVADATLSAMKAIWADPRTSLFDKFAGTRDWIYGQYLLFNPGGNGGRPWGLLSRFTMEADALDPTMRRLIRGSVDRLEDHIATGVRVAVERGELVVDAPQAGITLQIAGLMAVTGQMTRHSSGFDRLDDLLRWTYAGIERAYGATGAPARTWPQLPGRAPAIASRARPAAAASAP